MSQQQVNIADLDLSSLQQVKTQLEEVFFFFFFFYTIDNREMPNLDIK